MPDETDLTDNGLSNIIKVSIKRNHKNMGKDLSVLFYFSTGGKMSATIKVEQEKKEKLDKFLASLLLRQGIKITQQEILGLIIDYALQNEEQIIQKLEELPPLEEDPAWKAIENPTRWGIKDSSKRIDEHLYGR
jgi:transcriptional/translational regulatory protein YebC/TACO1